MISRITINEHSSIRIEAEKIIYIDPFRILSETHDADIIFITHAHYDHFSPEDILKINQPHTLYVMPCSMQGEETKIGVSIDRVIWLQPNESANIAGIPVYAMPSYNTNKPMHPKENGWLGYVLELNGQNIYIAGDCDIMPEAETLSCDIAMVPIGATYTMNAEEAATLINQMKPKTVIPTHYGTLVGKPEDVDLFEPLVDSAIKVCRKL